jgi:exoribonuclease R
MLRKVHVEDRDYTNWKWFDGFTLESIECELNPLHYKMFSEDIIEIKNNNENDNQNIKIVHSSVRYMKYIPGILVLSGNTFGRIKGKLLYKCVPDDRRMPTFLVPYEIKSDFNKNHQDLYVTFQYTEWNDKHPIGRLTNNLGKVNKLSNFYEYQLYCKSLNATIQDFTKNTLDALKQRTEEEFITSIMTSHPQIIDRTHDYVFSIDPPKSLDIDDAMSIKYDEINDRHILTIYIANVGIWMDSLNLWSSFSERISTIYLPDRKRPMLPNILSDCLCSLLEKRKRFSYYLDVYIKNNNIVHLDMGCSLINVYRNYRYEEGDLLNDYNYKSILNVVLNLSKNVKLLSSIKDSHDLVNYLMVLINSKCAEKLIDFKEGVYRCVKLNSNIRDVPDTIPEDIGKFLKLWNSSSGQYSIYSQQQGHILVGEGLEYYVHISSPIRRLVDLLNSIKLQQLLGIFAFSQNALEFYDKWIGRLDYINTTMRAIRKVQSDCSILDMVSKNISLMDESHEGYLFDKIDRNDGLFQYIVYLHKFKILSRVTLRINIENYSIERFKIYIFNDETTLKRKIRLHIQ